MSITSVYYGGYDGRPGWWIAFDFDPDRITSLKTLIPYEDQEGWCRSWDEAGKRWWVAQEYIERLFPHFPQLEAFVRAVPLPGFEL